MTEKNKEKSIRKSIVLVITVILLMIAAFIASGYYAISTFLSVKQADKTMLDNLIRQNEQTVKQTSQSITNSAEELEKGLYLIGKGQDIQKLLSPKKNEAIEYLLTEFKSFKESNPEVESIFLGAADKKMYIFPELQLPEDYDPTSRPWYINALNNKDFTWSEPYMDISTNAAIITLSLPVYNENEVLGVLSVDINLNKMVEKLKNITLEPNGYMIITDQNGIMLVNPNKQQVGQPIHIEVLKELIAQGNEGTVRYVYNGVEELAIHSKIDKLKLNLIGLIKR